MLKYLSPITLLLLCPAAAEAYVDPGLIAVLYQFLYVAVFGALASLIFKPWRYLKSLLGGKDTEDATGDGSDDEEENEDKGESA